jgi:hypothetical protein
MYITLVQINKSANLQHKWCQVILVAYNNESILPQRDDLERSE